MLASVAGTTEAQEARMDAQLPQTAKVDRRTAQCDVHYDGTPQFSPIANTNLQVAENANVTVLQTSDGRYFAVDNGIWFVSNTPTGPWEVANERPTDVERIPPQSPAYNTKYVYVYDYTPDYVYMGYTPGYLGSYISGPTVVYGTGWYYRPWYRRYYYPRPVTWGFGFCYNPWTGWNMSFGMVFNFGWYHMGGSYPYYGGWFGGPAYWRPPYRPWGWNGGYYGRRGAPIRTTRPNVRVNRPRNMYAAPARANYAAVNRGHSNNIYNRAAGIRDTRDVRPGIVRPGTSPVRPGVPGNDTRPVRPGTPGNDTRPTNPGTAPVRPGTPGNDTRPVRPGVPGTTPTRPVNPTPRPGTNPQRPATRPNNNSNNVLTDPDGNVYQRNNNGGWDQRNNSRWQSSGQNRNADLDRQQSSRERGANRNDNFRQTMPQRSTQPAQRQSTPQRSAPPPQRQ
ncbi:hypothetical protein MKQ70_10895 [Chitinophaga sedimenti]|uniref:hypothetical protein n=1 Tax=Chitinophaga sedimenti TaxID=2033606 RepID=UPI0020059F64|nr:hypothetical protein [Chitinophaga sedimenti]MCK7555486.1 hypothetical protein [Chitinophaga sedimenti]